MQASGPRPPVISLRARINSFVVDNFRFALSFAICRRSESDQSQSRVGTHHIGADHRKLSDSTATPDGYSIWLNIANSAPI